MQNCDRCGFKIHYWMPRRIWFCHDCINKNEILFEGVLIKVDPNSQIEVGDLYLAKRNVGWKLLTCKDNSNPSFIIPVENAYYYSRHECYKIVGV